MRTTKTLTLALSQRERGAIACILFAAVAFGPLSAAEEGDASKAPAEHMRQCDMRLADDVEVVVELCDRSLLNFGDSARGNQSGSLWAFGKSGRPLAFLELYKGTEANATWVHAVTLTGDKLVAMKTPAGTPWKPASTQIEPRDLSDAPAPEAKPAPRLRQMKDMARRFTAHEFWEPENSRFELRLLVQPVHRYADESAQIHDGAAFILAHDTNPEIILLIEASGPDLERAKWRYSLARLGSAELHVELDGGEVWKRDRTPGILGDPGDPYWLFLSSAAGSE